MGLYKKQKFLAEISDSDNKHIQNAVPVAVLNKIETSKSQKIFIDSIKNPQ